VFSAQSGERAVNLKSEFLRGQPSGFFNKPLALDPGPAAGLPFLERTLLLLFRGKDELLKTCHTEARWQTEKSRKRTPSRIYRPQGLPLSADVDEMHRRVLSTCNG
jgi:hypothetical protein